jgi:UDP-N-acetylmuramate--alanine ligase
MLDECLLLEIYPARELPIDGVNSQWLLSKVSSPVKKLLTKEQVLEYLQTNKTEVVITMGAGDIDTMVEPIEVTLKSKN